MQQHSSSGKDIEADRLIHARADTLRSLESILNAAGLAVITAMPDGRIITFNIAAEKLLGYTAAEVTGKIAPIISKDRDDVPGRSKKTSASTRQKIEAAFEGLITESSMESAGRNDWTLTRKDGSHFLASVTVVPLRGDAEKITGYAAIISDLTEQQSLREQIGVSEQKFRLLAENIPGIIYLCHNDETYSIIYINDHVKTITGYDAEQFVKGEISYPDLFHPDESDFIRDTINHSVAERKSFRLRYRLRHASGEWRWVDENGVGVFEGDRLTMLEGFIQDVTVQKDAEEKLQKIAEENLRFFNNPVNLNAVVDFAGNLQRISPSWTKMLGWTEEELKSKPVAKFIHPDDVQATRDALKYISTSGKVHTFENRFARKDGSYRWLLWGSASDLTSKMIYASAIDISGRKESEEHILDSKSNLESITLQLQEQNRRLDEFAHIISHNLRAPVNNIQALINLLDDKSQINDYKLIFDKLKNVAKNLSETMNELMDTLKARSESHVDLSEMRFKEVLDKVVQSLEGELIVAQADVTFDFNEAPAIQYSKPYLESIFQNLLTNAIKYRSPQRKPAIHFRSYTIDGHVELQVRDNGQGIDMDRYGDKLFGLHKTFHQHQEARGVGLFLVKTQIEALGGSISASSEVDKGTTFTIRFK